MNLKLLVIAGMTAGALSYGAPVWAQDPSYHILVTNDDGVQSLGLQAVAAALRQVGTVHVVAPCGERSGSSMAVALRDELELRQVGEFHCVDTTPAGTVLLAITTLAPVGGFDLIVSGINRGANVGTVSHMSGTVGAAMMGASYGVPAVAASMTAVSQDYGYAAAFVRSFVEELKERPARPGVVFSINIPQPTVGATRGVRVVPMGGAQLRFGFEVVGGDDVVRRYRPQIGLETTAPPGSDTAAFLEDFITITPLQFDWTATYVVGEISTWHISPVANQ